MAFLSGYTKRWEYKVLATKVPSTRTDFPVYVDLGDMPASFWSTVADGGGDIRVTRSDGTTECAREVVSCATTTDTGELHFLANSVDGTTDTVFYIYANGTSADYAVTDTYGRNAVWVGYTFVAHCNDTSGGLVNSTGGNNASVLSGTVTYGVAGKLGNAISLPGTVRMSVSGNLFSSAFTFSQWQTRDAASGTFDYWYDSQTSRYLFYDRPDADPVYVNGTRVYPSGTGITNTAGEQFMVHNVSDAAADQHAMYKNGSVVRTETTALTAGTPTTTYLFSRFNGTDFFTGDISEIRFAALARTTNWITTEYNNQSDHSTWATIGAEETDGGGGGGGATFNNFKGFGGL